MKHHLPSSKRHQSASLLIRLLVGGSATVLATMSIAAHADTTTYTPADNPGSPDLASGDTFVLTGGQVVFGSDSSADFTFDGTVTGDGGLTKAGAETLTLNAVNSYTGGTVVSDGTLVAAVSGALPTGGEVTVDSEGTLNLEADQSIGTLSGSGTLNLEGSTLTTNVASGTTTTFSGNIGDSITELTYVGSWQVDDGPYWGTAPTAYSGQEAAASIFGGDASDYVISTVSSNIADINYMVWGDIYAGTAATPVAQDYTNDVNGDGLYDSTGDFSAYVSDHSISATNYAFAYAETEGGGGLTLTGGGTLILSGVNTYTGTTEVADGTLEVLGGAAIADTGAVVVDADGTFEVGDAETIGSLAGSGATVLDATLTTGGNDADTIYSGVISGIGGLTKEGTGTMTLSGVNTYTGDTLIEGGTLKVLGGSAITDSGAVVVDTAGTFEVGDAETVGSLAGSGAIVLDAALTTGGNNADTSYSGSISGVGGLTKEGTSTMTLSGVNTYTGDTMINAGTLLVSGGSAIADTGAVSIGTDATFEVADAETIGSLAGSGATVLDATLTTGGNDADTTYSGAISGVGGLTKEGTGTMTLSGVNTYTGDSTINAGMLLVSGGSAIADTGAVSVGTDATFEVADAETIGSLSGSGATLLGATLTTGGNNADTSYSGSISGTGGLVKAGTGTMTLESANSYTGGTTVSGGTLVAAVSGALSTGGDVAVASTGTLSLGADQSIGALSGEGTVNLGANTLTTNVASGTTTFSGSISDSAEEMTYVGSWNVSDGPAWTSRPEVMTAQETAAYLFGGEASDYAISSVSSDVADIDYMAWGSGYGGFDSFAPVAEDFSVDAGDPGYGDSGDFSTYVSDWSDQTNYAFAMEETSQGGGLVKTGAGTLILSGVNTYTGATEIEAGTLEVLGGAAIADTGAVVVDADGTFEVGDAETIGSLSGSGAVVLDATLTTGGNDADTAFSGVISGVGGLTKSGTGTMTLSGVNTYTGDTMINAGTLLVSGGSAIADTGAVSVGSAGTFEVADAETIGSLAGSGAVVLDATLTTGGNNADTTFDGSLSGTGGLTKEGTGTMTLGGTNSYTGATIVNAGTLALASTLDPSTTLAVNGGTFDLGGLTQAVSGFTGTSAGTVALGDGVLDVTQDSDSTYSGAFTGTGTVIKDGAGTLTLDGTDSFDGSYEVDAGTLAMNGVTTGAVFVNTGALLTGTGSIGGLTVGSGGTVSPGGDAIGTLKVTGNVSLQSGSTYVFNVNAAGQSDRIAATGTATISGTTLDIEAAGGTYANATHYTVLTASGGVSGTFGDVTTNLAFLTPVMSYDAFAAYVDLLRNDVQFTDIAKSSNQTNVAAKIETLGIDDSVYRSILYMTAQEARAQFDDLSGEIHASNQTEMLNDTALATHAVLDHLSATPARSGMWVQGLSNWSRIAADGEASRTSSNTQGLLGGMDIALGTDSGVRVGVAGGYSYDETSANVVHSSSTLKGGHLLGYVAADLTGVKVRVGGGYSHYKIDTTRNITVADTSQSERASYTGHVVYGFGELSVPLQLGGGVVEPFGSLTVAQVTRAGFVESGGSMTLSGARDEATTGQSTLGLRLETAPAARFSVRGKLGWEHLFGDTSPTANLSFTGIDGSYEVNGAPLSRNGAVVNLTGLIRLSDKVSLSAGYDGRIGSQNTSSTVQAALSILF